MFNNYSFKSSLWYVSLSGEKHIGQKTKSNSFAMMILMLLFAVTGIQAQTQRIPSGDGNFSNGSTFAANGWTVANQGVSPVKWAVGTAASGTTQASTLNSTTAVTLSAANAGIVPGQLVYGAGIAANTYVVSVAGTSLVLSQSATLTGSYTLGFGVFTGGISVGTTQITSSAAITAGSYTLALLAANPNISVGMLIASNSFIAANTYVSSISGTTLGLSQATTAASAGSQTLTFSSTSAAISGNAAYISNDSGATNSNAGYSTARTVYFHRDITGIPANQTAMTLTFDVKSAPSSGGGWQVWIAPTSQTVTGTDTQVTTPFTYNPIWAGATLISFNSQPQVATTKTTAFIPTAFAGTSFRLIFVWAQSGAATIPPAAIDNISLTSRIPEEIESIASGLWSLPSTWNVAKVPTPADGVAIVGTHTVMVDSRYSGAQDLTLAGTNSFVLFGLGSTIDDFTIANDLNILGSGARFNGNDGGTNGKNIKVGHDVYVGASACRLDISSNSTAQYNGALTLNGSTLQTVTVETGGFIGGSAVGINGFGNRARVLNQLIVTNTSTATPNVVFNASAIINGRLELPSGRISVSAGQKITIGNFGQTSNLFITPGSGFTNGMVARYNSSSNTRDIQPSTEYPGSDNNAKPYWFPFVSGANMDRSLYLLPASNATTAGEVAVTYVNSNTMTTGLAIADGSYTINNRFGANWSFSTPDGSVTGTPVTYANSGTNRIAVYANGAYEALDGSSRLMNLSTALPGAHQEGTAQPFAMRTGLTLADLTTAPIYVGVSDASKMDTTVAITSLTSGAWDATGTWVGGVVPTCANNVIIASGHTVTVATTADAAGVVVNAGGTLVNNGAATTMTVGCTNNNAAFYNYGTYTMTSGTLKVNGFMAHKLNSTFNQTGGDIVIDSNDNGNAATSVAFGGTSCKIETSLLGLTGGKITIVDPLVNIGTPVAATSIGNFTLNTAGAAGTFSKTTTSAITTNSFTVASDNLYFIGQTVTGHANIPSGTTVTAVSVGFVGFPPPVTITLSANVTATVPTATALNFSAMHNGGTALVLEAVTANSNLAVGQTISGSGIQAGTTITSIVTGQTLNPAVDLVKLNLSLPTTPVSPTPITAQQTLTFAAVNVGAFTTILPAVNPSIQIGMIVKGTGIKPGTFVANISGAAITFSEPIQAGAPSPLVMDFYPFNTLSSGSFIYSSAFHYAAGLNHTLQIGDGVSIQNTAIISNGFNCQFQGLGSGQGLFSIGNLIVDAPDGDNRFMNVSSNNTNNAGAISSGFNINVQNNLTITTGSAFRKNFGNSTVFVGGNIVNNGSFNLPMSAGTPLYLGNLINGVAVPSTLPQTISGSGSYLANQSYSSSAYPSFAVGSLTINNTSVAGVTIGVPNFRMNSVTLTNGIVHTSATYPIYCGSPEVTNALLFPGSFSGGSATAYFDGPIVHANRFDSNITQYRLYPTGKNGKFLPILMSSTGGVELMAEAFDTNTGTVNPVNGSALSTNRWKVTRVGALGNFTGYNVRLGSFTGPVTASNILVHAAADQGTYNVVANPASATSYELAYFGTPTVPTLFLTTAQTGGFLGNFSYSNGPACTGTPVPVAAATATSLCSGQSTTLSLTGLTGNGFTYQWQANTGAGFADIPLATAVTYVATPAVNTSYQCIVTCASTPGTSNAVAITVSQSTATTTGTSICDSGVANLSASGSPILNWYNAATGGTLLTTGTTYSPSVSSTTTFYVASASTSAGAVNTGAWVGTSASSALFKGIAFDVTNKLKLKTVTVYPKNTVALTPITISLFDASGNIVAGTTPLTFTPNLVTGTIGTASQIVTLNYNIPVGTGYRLVATYGLVATTNTLGNSTAVITYPTSGALRLTGNVSALNDAIATTANTTNCFHNLTFDETCESITRTPVTATVNTSSVAPTGATGTLSIACGGNTTLTVTGGFAGTGATAEWFTASCGGTPAGTGNSILVSPTVTTTYYVRYNGTCNTTTCGSVTVTVGVCSSIVNLKLFVEGYYDTTVPGTMIPVKNNQDGVSPMTDVENIIVELHNATTPWALVASTTALLKTNGTAVCTYPTAPSGSFYIAVKTGNAVQTWSATPQTVGAVPLTYDFSTAATQAYGDNMVSIGGVYCFYSGDINQDEVVDNTDAPILAVAIDGSAFGIQVTDLNGDGAVDNSDAPFFENNSANSIFAQYPVAP